MPDSHMPATPPVCHCPHRSSVTTLPAGAGPATQLMHRSEGREGPFLHSDPSGSREQHSLEGNTPYVSILAGHNEHGWVSRCDNLQFTALH